MAVPVGLSSYMGAAAREAASRGIGMFSRKRRPEFSARTRRGLIFRSRGLNPVTTPSIPFVRPRGHGYWGLLRSRCGRSGLMGQAWSNDMWGCTCVVYAPRKFHVPEAPSPPQGCAGYRSHWLRGCATRRPSLETGTLQIENPTSTKKPETHPSPIARPVEQTAKRK
jgi:hypothetical protein